MATWAAKVVGSFLSDGVVGRRPQTLDRGVESDHLAGRGVTGAVGIESAVNFVAAAEQSA